MKCAIHFVSEEVGLRCEELEDLGYSLRDLFLEIPVERFLELGYPPTKIRAGIRYFQQATQVNRLFRD